MTNKRERKGKGNRHRHLPAFLLLFLYQGASHGGALYTALREKVPVFTADSGAVYRTLKDLEKSGAVEAHWDTSEPGPARKIYQITEKGKQELSHWYNDIQWRMKNLTYFIGVCENLGIDKQDQ